MHALSSQRLQDAGKWFQPLLPLAALKYDVIEPQRAMLDVAWITLDLQSIQSTCFLDNGVD